MDIKKKFYYPESEMVELIIDNSLLQASGLGVGSGNGSRNVEEREDGGSWGNGDWY